MNPAHERRVREILNAELPDLHVSLSTDILPEPPEFERTATTVANAYCAPILRRYMDTLEAALRDSGFGSDIVLVMHNGGGTMTTDYAKGAPVKTLNSGPAAGVIAGAAVAASCGRHDVVCFDMGGTSADIAVVRDGEPQLTRAFDLEWGMPIRFPSIDVISIGAGGGSIAWLDPAGYPRSGPQSAGADPGPACYGKGGAEPTNTDAQLVLGRVSNDLFLEGRMQLDVESGARGDRAADRRAARSERRGGRRGCAADRQREHGQSDPARHRRAWLRPSRVRSRRLRRRRAVARRRPCARAADARGDRPGSSRVTSALGLLFVDPLDDFSWSFVRRQDQIDLAQLRERYEEMDDRVRDSLVRQGVAPDAIVVDRSIDLRYIGQLHSVTVPLTEISEAGFAAATAAFHDEHLRQYRYSHPDAPVETSALRVAARGTRAKPDLSRMRDGSDRRAAVAERERPVHFGEQGWLSTRVVDRNSLGPGDEVRGPAIVDQLDSTIVLPPGTAARVDEVGNVIISTGEDA